MPISATIPYDEDAEAIVVGFAIDNGTSAAAAAAMLDATDFYDQALGRIFDAAIQLGELRGQERRLDVLVEVLELPRRRLEMLTAQCPGLDYGTWRHRVRELARRRRLMGLAAHLYNEAALLPSPTLCDLSRAIAVEVTHLAEEDLAHADASGV